MRIRRSVRVVMGLIVVGLVGAGCGRPALSTSGATVTGGGTVVGRYIISADGVTVTDTSTGLVWQRDHSGPRAGCTGDADGNPTCTWDQAKAYCAGLDLDGRSWRLPTAGELLSIVDLLWTQRLPVTRRVQTYPKIPYEWSWTSSPSTWAGHHWIVHLYGEIERDNMNDDSYGVRCVAPGTGGVSQYRVSSDGLTVTDSSTGLVWQRDGSGARNGSDCNGTWCGTSGAVAYCDGLELDGTGWRLPEFEEFLSILDPTVTSPPTINQTVFPNTPSDCFAMSVHLHSLGVTYEINFSSGDLVNTFNDNCYRGDRVRCVR